MTSNRYWSFVKSHPAHILLPPSARQEAMDVPSLVLHRPFVGTFSVDSHPRRMSRVVEASPSSSSVSSGSLYRAQPPVNYNAHKDNRPYLASRRYVVHDIEHALIV